MYGAERRHLLLSSGKSRRCHTDETSLHNLPILGNRIDRKLRTIAVCVPFSLELGEINPQESGKLRSSRKPLGSLLWLLPDVALEYAENVGIGKRRLVPATRDENVDFLFVTHAGKISTGLEPVLKGVAERATPDPSSIVDVHTVH